LSFPSWRSILSGEPGICGNITNTIGAGMVAISNTTVVAQLTRADVSTARPAHLRRYRGLCSLRKHRRWGVLHRARALLWYTTTRYGGMLAPDTRRTV